MTSAIESLITQLVQQAPALELAVIDELVDHLRGDGSPLAMAIARVVELVGEQLVDPGIALPALAMACATLAHTDPRAREAARYEIDTLLPMPDGPRMKIMIPDVPTSRLSRVPRRRPGAN